MSKIISYSIFGLKQQTKESMYEWRAYLRGLFFNAIMNRLVFPGFETSIQVDVHTFSEYDHVFRGLQSKYDCSLSIHPEDNLCKSMLWRLRPIFREDAEYVFCRDADALTSYREAMAAQQFIDSGLALHGIHDNPAHSIPLMGGMCGFKCEPIRQLFRTYDNMIAHSTVEINQRGSDQQFLNSLIFPEFQKDNYFNHVGPTTDMTGFKILDPQDNPLWESRLCVAFIGAAGVNELETVRFFRRFAPDLFNEFNDVAKKYPDIFNWMK